MDFMAILLGSSVARFGQALAIISLVNGCKFWPNIVSK